MPFCSCVPTPHSPTQFGKQFHTSTILLVKQYFLKSYLDRPREKCCKSL